MKLKQVYLTLTAVGTVLPYWAFLPWLAEHSLNLPLLLQQIASSPVAAFGWLDVAIAAVTLLVFMRVDSRAHKVRSVWLAVVGTLTVDVSLGLPLYLFLRERAKAE
jgi:hypothetical protein